MSQTPEENGSGLSSLSRRLTPGEVNMDLTKCGLLPEQAELLARLYAGHGNWNDVKEEWYEDRLADRSTRDSSQGIFSVLSSRFKNAPKSLPNPAKIPSMFEECQNSQSKGQILFMYAIADDSLVRYTVHEYARRFADEGASALDFSDEALGGILDALEYGDGTGFDYAESTVKRWNTGFRSLMRKIGVLEDGTSSTGEPPSVGNAPLLVGIGYSSMVEQDGWTSSPRGLQYLFQPEERWRELYDRAVETDVWEYLGVHGDLKLRPVNDRYPWSASEGAN